MSSFNKLQLRNFVCWLLVFSWWPVWLIILWLTSPKYFYVSSIVYVHSLVFVFSMLLGSILGWMLIALYQRTPNIALSFQVQKVGLLKFGAFIVTFFLIFLLAKSGALTTSFIDYHNKLRGVGFDPILFSGFLDLFVKYVVYPIVYSLLVVSMFFFYVDFVFVFICLMNVFLYSYLWQVNYPISMIFWLGGGYWLLSWKISGRLNFKFIFLLLLIFLVLLLSAINRVGAGPGEALERYLFGYGLTGFYLYDYQVNLTDSLIHELSYGRSFLGWFDRSFDLFFRFFGSEYIAASHQNVNYLMVPVEAKSQVFSEVNAFGTIMFTLYRDFWVAGIILGGFLVGLALVFVIWMASRYFLYRPIFLVLASSIFYSTKMSPVEQPYFWFSILFLFFVFRFGLIKSKPVSCF